MSRKSRTNPSTVERLLEQRRLFQDWLTKLEGGVGETMPGHVVERVRNDYRTRLTAVMEELTEHDDAIRQALADAQGRHDGLEHQQQSAKDELAEARLRKQVGELGDAEFKELNARLKNTIDDAAKDLAASLRDIERYEEIIDLIAGEEEAPAPPPPAPAPAPAPVAAEAPSAPRPAADAGAARAPAAEEAPQRTPQMALDEIAFIRSVTTTMAPVKVPPKQEKAPAPEAAPAGARRSGATSALGERSADAQVIMDEPAAAVSPPPAPSRAPAAEPRAAKVEPEPRRKSEDARTAHAEGKALVCGECGAPNLPTEWYCEKCGAELSAF